MKRMIILPAIVLFSLYLPGCHKTCGKASDNGAGGDIVKQKSTTNKKFPDFLAGRWKSDRQSWGIEIAADGSIPAVFHPIWKETITVKEGYFTEGPKNSYAYFVLGDCIADYDPNTRNLKVQIMLDDFEISLVGGSITGRSEDYFEGPVSEDGKTWHADWRGYGYVEGATEPNKAEVDANPEKLVFTKISGSFESAFQ